MVSFHGDMGQSHWTLMCGPVMECATGLSANKSQATFLSPSPGELELWNAEPSVRSVHSVSASGASKYKGRVLPYIV